MTETIGNFAFLPLGGTGEIGMNLNLYMLDGHYLAVDCGIGFSGIDTPEAEILMPDPSFLAERHNQLCGLVVTHAHEDHLGAIEHLWPQFKCPIYATPFAAAVLRRKLGEARMLDKVQVNVIAPGARFKVGPFDLQFISVTHSVPEAQSLAIRTSYGNFIHTGDFKIDEAPLLGPKTDFDSFRQLGEDGVRAVIGDSTNVFREGPSGTEQSVREGLTALIADLTGRVAVTCFASNVARVESIAMAARAAGRKVVTVGRSLRNLEVAARECGYLTDIPSFLTEQDAAHIPDRELLLIVTGSQGEPRSALTRIAADTHPNISLGEGDTIIYSSRMIPGNEHAVIAVQDNLSRRGVRVLTDRDHPVHVSGHATSGDLRRLYEVLKPEYVVPTHGEWRHLTAHADLARKVGAKTVLLEDGDILQLAPGKPEIIDTAPTGRYVLDGSRILPLSSDVLTARRRMLYNGMVMGSFAVDDEGFMIGLPKISAPGLLESTDPETDRIIEDFANAIDDIPDNIRAEDDAFRDAAKTALRRALGRKLQKRPLVDVHLLRV